MGGSDATANPGLTPAAKHVVERAVLEANQFQHHFVGTGHLLLGLFGEDDDVLTHVFASVGVPSLHELRSRVLVEVD